jgi:hypothetical protein
MKRSLLAVLLVPMISAWSPQAPPLSRRTLFQDATAATAAAVTFGLALPSSKAQAASVMEELLGELTLSKEKLEAIPSLLEQEEWDKVRTILKTPPVNKLWNLGDSQNIVLKLAKESGNVELFELKDDLALNLQTCDQLTYANAFVYTQPGNGKINIKEPQDIVKRAMKQIQQAIEES